MPAYFDLRSGLYRAAFEDALPYDEYVATGSPGDRASWERAARAVPDLPEGAAVRLDLGGRTLRMLCLSGTWCGDCARSVPMLNRIARAAGPSASLRIIDRDRNPELRDELRILGAMRAPVGVFLTADFHEAGRFGDRTLSVYREKARVEAGAACPLPGAPDPPELLAAELDDWLDEFERVILRVRLAPARPSPPAPDATANAPDPA